MVLLGDIVPNFQADTTIGKIDFHDWIGDSWAILFSHPADFTPVCTTELARLVELMPEFTKRNVKIIALSCDVVENHLEWIDDIKLYSKTTNSKFPYPIIADPKRELAVRYGMLDPSETDSDGLPLTARAVFVIGPDKKMRLSLLYPATTGRNFIEILRVIDGMQLSDKHKIATPADWKQGEDVMIQPFVPESEAPILFPKGITLVRLASGKPYLRQTPQPTSLPISD